MLKEYRTLYKEGSNEILIEKSKFIGYAKPVYTEEEAISFIEKIKTRHKDATHNVPAYAIGDNYEIQRYSDDGEPSGTAGVPILELLKKENLKNIVVVVTRYFGGIKLGTGGLVRAYTKTAKLALESAKIIVKRAYKLIHITIDYSLLGKVQNEIIQNGHPIKEIEYDDTVHFFVYIEGDQAEGFKKQIVECTYGRCEIAEVQQDYLVELDGKIIFK